MVWWVEFALLLLFVCVRGVYVRVCVCVCWVFVRVDLVFRYKWNFFALKTTQTITTLFTTVAVICVDTHLMCIWHVALCSTYIHVAFWHIIIRYVLFLLLAFAICASDEKCVGVGRFIRNTKNSNHTPAHYNFALDLWNYMAIWCILNAMHIISTAINWCDGNNVTYICGERKWPK